jgi:hypothetical protein
MDKSSLLIWYPKTRTLPIPQPKTEILKLPDGSALRNMVLRRMTTKQACDEIRSVADRIGYPLFLRTDQTSAKHGWKKTCFVPMRDDLIRHIYELLDAAEDLDIMGLPVDALVFREYIDMDSKFTAFWGLPISFERRYFAEGGKVLCRHPYWPENAIKFKEGPEVLDWKRLLEEMNRETEGEVKLLTRYAEDVSKLLNGQWSIDFCKSLTGKWYLIDCARAEISWHPKDCPNCPEERKADKKLILDLTLDMEV